MLPIDDPSWPVCNEAGCANEGSSGDGWCAHIRDRFIANEDGNSFSAGMNYCVPIVPEFRLYAEINLGTDIISADPQMVELALVLPITDNMWAPPPDAGDLVPLGLHVAGEGRIEIAYNILAWAEANTLPECKDSHHSYPQEMRYQRMQSTQTGYDRKANMWCLAYYKKCWPCRDDELNPSTGRASVTPIPMDAGSFGLDDTVRDNNTANNSAQAALQNRFGNRRA